MRRVTAGIQRPGAIVIEIDGRSVPAYEGETVAAAMLASDNVRMSDSRHGLARGVYCNMGVCFECTVWEERVAADGKPRWCAQRACLLAVRPGMRLRTSGGAGPT